MNNAKQTAHDLLSLIIDLKEKNSRNTIKIINRPGFIINMKEDYLPRKKANMAAKFFLKGRLQANRDKDDELRPIEEGYAIYIRDVDSKWLSTIIIDRLIKKSDLYELQKQFEHINAQLLGHHMTKSKKTPQPELME